MNKKSISTWVICPIYSVLTLELSKKEAVTLAEEIDYLKSYIELQSLRLNKTLDYCFDTSIDLKLSEIFIPPLLIQPIVENAILHAPQSVYPLLPTPPFARIPCRGGLG
jgi:LytS/YehU family sensor histidine kinase